MPRQLLLEGPAIEPLLRQVREEHGESARVLKAERVRVGGVGGFFAKEKYEVTFEVDDPIDPRSDGRDGRAAPALTPGPARARRGATLGAPRGLAALLAAAEEAERATAAAPDPDESSPSAAALAAVREALASRAAAPAPLSTEKAAFTEVLDSVRSGLEGRSDGLAVPDDARALTGDDGLDGEDPEADEERATALEQLRRALDALGVVDDTHVPEAEGETEAEDEPEGEAGPEDADDRLLADGLLDDGLFDGALPDDQVWAEEVDAPRADGDGSAVQEERPPAHAVHLLQEMPHELVERTHADRAAPSEAGAVERDVSAVRELLELPPMTRRERRRAEAVRAQVPPEGPSPAEEEHVTADEDPVDDVPLDEVHQPAGPAPTLPTTLEGLGEPHPGEPLPDLPSVPADLMAAAALAVPGDDAPGDETPADDTDPADDTADPADPDHDDTARPEPATPPAPLAGLHDRLARLGLHGRWLDGLPDEQAPALRVIAERLTALDARPRRAPRVSDHPVVAVLAEGTGAGLETARTLALSLGLPADQVVALAAEDRRTARPGAEPLDRGAAARAAHAGRRRAQPVVVLVPVPFTPTSGERGAAAAALAALDADQVWAVVDATRRTADAQAWLRAVGPAGGVDAVALVGLAATTAPADALELGAPVVLLDGQPATAVDWVATLAAHLTREDVEAHLARLAQPGRSTGVHREVLS